MVDGIRQARETVRSQQRSFETAQADYDRRTAQIEQLDAAAEETRAQVQAQILAIERANGDIRHITEEQAGSESRIAVLNNDIAHNEAGIAARREEIRQSEEGQEALLAEIAEDKRPAGQAAGRDPAAGRRGPAAGGPAGRDSSIRA